LTNTPFRSLCAAENIKKQELILLIPDNKIITFERVQHSNLASKFIHKKFQNFFGENILFIAYILQDRKKPKDK
jgi:hypothetical protein